MYSRPSRLCIVALLLTMCTTGCVRRGPSSVMPTASTLSTSPSVVQATLTTPGSPPFHLKAIITERGDPSSKTDVEIFWAAPDKWRRTIHSQTEFSQTLIVNGKLVYEEDSDDYFPLWVQTLTNAMVDPKSVLDAIRPGDILLTKSNGASDEFGRGCFPDNPKFCTAGSFGLRESVGAAGHAVDFMNYQDFNGKRVARLLIHHIDAGDSYKAQVTELTQLENPAPELFFIAQPTTNDQTLRNVTLSEVEFRSFGLTKYDVIWPQVLDGKTTGTASYYVSVDRSGQVREVLPVHTDNERANDSARRQIMSWKFRPILKDGTPVQAESVLNFDLNTRAWGPPDPLTDEEARKLATNIVEPQVPPGIAPSGSTYTLRAAIDSDGRVIEVIAGDGSPKLFQPCYEALSKWHFSPIIENGEPRPYRAQITFRVH